MPKRMGRLAVWIVNDAESIVQKICSIITGSTRVSILLLNEKGFLA